MSQTRKIFLIIALLILLVAIILLGVGTGAPWYALVALFVMCFTPGAAMMWLMLKYR